MMGRPLATRRRRLRRRLLAYRDVELRFSRQDREELVAYMVKNFGPDAKPRRVRTDQEMPLDEAKLGKAMYIEYYLPPDPPGQGTNAPEFSKRPAFAAGGSARTCDSTRTATCG